MNAIRHPARPFKRAVPRPVRHLYATDELVRRNDDGTIVVRCPQCDGPCAQQLGATSLLYGCPECRVSWELQL
jgi:hypothetical protein